MKDFKREIENFLSPIGQDNPCGQSMKGHESLIKIQTYREQFNTTTPSDFEGHWTAGEENFSKWEEINAICEEILQNKSKDLSVVGYYMEAQTNLNGFEGFAKSVLLLKELCISYWEQIFPNFRVDFPDIRSAPFRWINKNIPTTVCLVNLLKRKGKAFSFFEYQTHDKKEIAFALENEDIEHLKNKIELIEFSKNNLLETMNYITNIYTNYEDFFSELVNCLDDIISLFKQTILKKENMLDSNIQKKNEHVNSNQEDKFILSKPNSREKAYEIIENANNFLLEYEPQSMVPYLIKRALKMQKMTMPALLEEVLSSISSKEGIFNFLGINTTHPPQEQEMNLDQDFKEV